MKKVFFAIMCMASFSMMTACGGSKDNKGNAEATPAENEPAKEQVTEEQEATATANEDDGTLDMATFASKVKEVCGLEPFTTDEMTKVKVWYSESEMSGKQYNMTSPVADGIDGEAIQREYFNAFAKVADGNKIYGFNMDGSRGTDAFSDYDEYVKFIKANGMYAKAQYAYDYNGKPIKIYCDVSFGDFGLFVTFEK